MSGGLSEAAIEMKLYEIINDISNSGISSDDINSSVIVHMGDF